MEYSAGQLVFSKCGHDKGGIFIITSVEEEYVYLADGKRRSADKPKRKKKKHVQPIKYVDALLKERLINGESVLNADLSKAIRYYLEGYRSESDM